MPVFGPVIPVLRIFDERKAREFYIDFLGCGVAFEHRFGENFPIYLGLSLGGCALHLSEHHGDANPGAHVRVQTHDVAAFIEALRAKDYKFAKPAAPGRQPWGSLEATIVDPFGNRLTFTQDVSAAEGGADDRSGQG